MHTSKQILVQSKSKLRWNHKTESFLFHEILTLADSYGKYMVFAEIKGQKWPGISGRTGKRTWLWIFSSSLFVILFSLILSPSVPSFWFCRVVIKLNQIALLLNIFKKTCFNSSAIKDCRGMPVVYLANKYAPKSSGPLRTLHLSEYDLDFIALSELDPKLNWPL